MADSGEAAHDLDEIDRTLVRELVADGRVTLAHLAATTGLSVSAVQSRVRRLEARKDRPADEGQNQQRSGRRAQPCGAPARWLLQGVWHQDFHHLG